MVGVVWPLGWRKLKGFFVFLLLELWKYDIVYHILSSSLDQWKYGNQSRQLSANENIPLVGLFTQQNTIQKYKMAPVAGCISRVGVKIGQFRPDLGEFDQITTKKSLKTQTQPTHRFTTIIWGKDPPFANNYGLHSRIWKNTCVITTLSISACTQSS